MRLGKMRAFFRTCGCRNSIRAGGITREEVRRQMGEFKGKEIQKKGGGKALPDKKWKKSTF